MVIVIRKCDDVLKKKERESAKFVAKYLFMLRGFNGSDKEITTPATTKNQRAVVFRLPAWLSPVG